MAECIFCKIASGAAPARKVYEDEAVIAFLDSSPISPGHCLVIPRKHVVWYTDLTPAEAGPFSKALYLVARQVKQASKAEYVNILIRGTRIPHLHAHLIPKLAGQDTTFDKILDLHQFIQTRHHNRLDDAALDTIARRVNDAAM
jgi:histidine triad (HIT) family protein